MRVLDLACRTGHRFEGWFGSDEDFSAQCASGLVTCPVCGDPSVSKQLSAPRLNLGRGQTSLLQPKHAMPSTDTDQALDGAHRHSSVSVAGPESQISSTLQAEMLRALRRLVSETEDVGRRFADQARRMHHGELPSRSIRGQASTQEALELLEEGVPVLPLPDLPLLKEPLQ